MLFLVLFGLLGVDCPYGRGGGIGHTVHTGSARHGICQTVGTEVSSLEGSQGIGGHLTRTGECAGFRVFIFAYANLCRPGKELYLGFLGLQWLFLLHTVYGFVVRCW